MGLWNGGGILRFGRREDGAAAVEFAIVGSLLFMMLCGIIEFGIVFNRYQGLQAGGREGARLASLSQSTVGQIFDRVRNSVSIIDTSSAQENCTSATFANGQYCITLTTTKSGWTYTATDTKGCTSASGAAACTAKPFDLNSG